MWIGTSSGLNLLDGSTITVFKNVPGDSFSLCNNSIHSITGDSRGLVWIGTQEGLQYFDPVFRNFHLVPVRKNNTGDVLPVNSLATDQMDNLYIATTSGLFFYTKKNKEVSYLELPGNNDEKILNNEITHIAFAKDGLLWLSTFNGLWSYDSRSHQFIHKINRNNDPQFTKLFTTFIVDHTGKLWIGTWDGGLKVYDPSSGKLRTFNKNKSESNIGNLAEIKQPGNKYLVLVNGNKEFSASGFHPFMPFSNLESADATTVFSLDSNMVWIGTRHGLYYLNLSRNLFSVHFFAHTITDQGVAVLEWKNKILISGRKQSFLKAYDSKWNVTDIYGNKFTQDGISCLSMQFSDSDKIRCGTSAGIADIDLLNHSIHFDQLPANSGSSTLNFITCLLKDYKGGWWIFPWRNGIWATDSSGKTFTQVFNNFITRFNIPKPLVISSACEDKHHNIWFGDYDEGIIFYNHQTKIFSKPFLKYGDQIGSVSQIFYWNNSCYTFSDNSLLVWNVDSLVLQKIKLPPQTGKTITTIASDSLGNLWLATRGGLFAYDLKKNTFTHFTTADGLPGNDMDGTLFCLKNGTMIFACPNYLFSFEPKILLTTIKKIPEIKLSEVIVNGKLFPFDISKKEIFGHNIHNFIFKWAVTDYTNPLSNRYFYQLQNADTGWRFVGKTGEIEFANLSAGSYTLLLKGENSNGITADNILKLQFYIAFPFWRTWWFLTILFFGVGLVFYFLYRYRLSHVLKIEKLRNKISLNLHDDIGSTLSSISILSDMALHGNSEPRTEEMLVEIKENSILMMERMDDIVWSINPNNDSLESLFLRIKVFAAKLFEAKGINYKIEIDESIKNIHISMENRQHIYLLMKEAINNLVKYSECTEAEILVIYQSTLLKIKIKDNGKGFDMGQERTGNGLYNMKKRAYEMNGKIEIHSMKNEGTKIGFTVKI